MKIRACQVFNVKTPLTCPYVLSFFTVDQIDSIVIRLTMEDGGVGVSEAVPLPGYSHETVKTIITGLQKILPGLFDIDSEEFEPYLTSQLPASPFAVSAVLTAKEFALSEFSLPDELNIPLVAPISSCRKPEEVIKEALGLYTHGYRTIKLKVGRDIEWDCACTSVLLNEMPDDVKIRIDVNQGYSLRQACSLLKILQHERNYLIECLEQPFSIDAWQEFREFAERSQRVVPLMLDESIVNESDIEKAADVGADLIKLKLFKHCGIRGLLAMALKAKDLGLEIIFGNGVASEIGNLAEAMVFKMNDIFTGAFEGNGFSKLSRHILLNHPEEINGHMRWENNTDQHKPMELDKNNINLTQIFGERHDY